MTIVIDTNVLIRAVRSRRGASFRLLSLVGTGAFEIVISVPLVVEYEYALLKTAHVLGIAEEAVSDTLDYVCRVAHHQEIFFLWRPVLRDPSDDMVLEVAVASEAQAIITYNRRDFRGAEKFGLEILTPKEFLTEERLL